MRTATLLGMQGGKSLRYATRGVFVLTLAVASSSYGQDSDGYIGIYRDAAGTQACASVPPYTAAALYVFAVAAGASATGISGAEFRIEVTNPSGWYISYTPPATANVVRGNPIDTDPNPNSGGGVDIAFPACQTPTGGKVPLGTVNVFNFAGSPTELVVRRHSTPSNSLYDCANLILCDSPVYTKVCSTWPPNLPLCSLSVSKPQSQSNELSFSLSPIATPPTGSIDDSPFSETLALGETELWVMGTRLSDPVTISFENDSLVIGGVPLPLLTGVRPSDDSLSRTFGAVPFVADQVKEGFSISQAVDLFNAQVDALVGQVEEAYRSGHFSSVRDLLLASPLVSEVELDESAHTVTISYHGTGGKHLVCPADLSLKHLTRGEAARGRVRTLKTVLQYSGPKLVWVERSNTRSIAGPLIAAAHAQIAYVEASGDLANVPAGPLTAHELRLILQRGKVAK